MAHEIVHERARAILMELGVKRLPTPLKRVARKLDIEIQFVPLEGELSGLAFIKSGVRRVSVNSLHHPNRQSFTIAHEIGHHVLHSDLLESGIHVDKTILRRDLASAKGIEKKEIEANQFASELLMPEYLFSPLASKLDHDDDRQVAALAAKLQVSTAALQYRLLRR